MISSDRGFGFTSSDDQSDGDNLFFHHATVRNDGFGDLQIGQRIEFDIVTDSQDSGCQRSNDVTPIVRSR